MALEITEIRNRLEAEIGTELKIGSDEELQKGQADFRKWGSGVIRGSREWIIDQLAGKLVDLQATSLSCESAEDYDWQASKLEGFCVRLQALIPGDMLAGYYVGRIGNEEYGAFGCGIMEDSRQEDRADDRLRGGSSDGTAIAGTLKVLVAVALADGHIDDGEHAILQEFCRRHGLDLAQLSAAIDGPMVVDRGKLPQTREDKLAMLVDVVMVARADGRVEDGEKRIVAKIAKALGLDRDDVKECVTKAVHRSRSPSEGPIKDQQSPERLSGRGAAGADRTARPEPLQGGRAEDHVVAKAALTEEELADVAVMVAAGPGQVDEWMDVAESGLPTSHDTGKTPFRYDLLAGMLIEFSKQGHTVAHDALHRMAQWPFVVRPGSKCAIAISLAKQYVEGVQEQIASGADVRKSTTGGEQWEEYGQYVSFPSGASDSDMTSGSPRMQFMFASMSEANKILTSLPKELSALLKTGRTSDSFDPGANKYVFSCERAVMTVRQAKDIMNHVVASGGEIYEALLG